MFKYKDVRCSQCGTEMSVPVYLSITICSSCEFENNRIEEERSVSDVIRNNRYRTEDNARDHKYGLDKNEWD